MPPPITKSYFPALIRLTEGRDKGKVMEVEYDQVPINVAFRILITNSDLPEKKCIKSLFLKDNQPDISGE